MTSEEKYDITYQNRGYRITSCGFAYVDMVLKGLKFKTVLDVGCGSGYSVVGFLKAGKVARGIESCRYLLGEHLASFVANGVVVYGRMQQIPYPPDEFDLVYCTDVLEHIPEHDVHQCIGELIRVSKKYVFVSISTKPALFMPHLNLHETVRPREWWEDQIKQYRVKLRKCDHPQRTDNGGSYVITKI